MRYSQAKHGRVFVVRLEHGDIVHEELEKLAKREEINAAAVVAVGAADRGSCLVVGPKDGDARPVAPMSHILDGAHEIAAVGTIFPNGDGNPTVHIHMACGRGYGGTTGCIRKGVKTWQTIEAVVFELIDTQAARLNDPVTGFDLLEPEGK